MMTNPPPLSGDELFYYFLPSLYTFFRKSLWKSLKDKKFNLKVLYSIMISSWSWINVKSVNASKTCIGDEKKEMRNMWLVIKSTGKIDHTTNIEMVFIMPL